MDPDNPVYLSTGGLVISIRAAFTGDITAGIAMVKTSGYGYLTRILDSSYTLFNSQYCQYFNVDGKGFNNSLNNAGLLLP